MNNKIKVTKMAEAALVKAGLVGWTVRFGDASGGLEDRKMFRLGNRVNRLPIDKAAAHIAKEIVRTVHVTDQCIPSKCDICVDWKAYLEKTGDRQCADGSVRKARKGQPTIHGWA